MTRIGMLLGLLVACLAGGRTGLASMPGAAEHHSLAGRLFVVDPGHGVRFPDGSPLNVGAAALLIMSEERAKELGLKPKVRIRAMAVAGVDPSSTHPPPCSQTIVPRAPAGS